MEEIVIKRVAEAEAIHKNESAGYEYYKRELVPATKGGQCKVSLYEIPPKQAAYPYHYHIKNEEVFYVLQGSGLLKTPDGEKTVTAGDFIFFPANEKGAHKLTNTSDTDKLVYLDFDTYHQIDIVFYPESEKIGLCGWKLNQFYKMQDQVPYYDGE